MVEWQPFETAPRTGLSVLWGHPEHGVQQGHWANGPVSCVYDEDCGYLSPFRDPPTHWMPLPDKPSEHDIQNSIPDRNIPENS